MAQVIDLAAARRAKAQAKDGGLAKLTTWRVPRTRKEWLADRANQKRFAARETL